MTSLRTILTVICGAIAGAIVALIISHGSTTKTVTDIVASSGKAVPTALTKSGGISINQIYKQDSPGVVDIDVTSQQSGTSNGFFQTPPTTSEDEGAGVVFDKQGDIVTDEHVVAGATSVTVNFQDGYSAKAKVLGTDPSTDVAVIRVNAPQSQLHPIPFADSSSAQVGDPVVAIGSPFGLPETVTAGIVSAVGRSITAPNGYTITGAIQTDAAINPGNSGGPLLNAAGDVLGLNDQIQTSSGSSAGIGFATPANADIQVINAIIAGKPVKHPYVGVCLENPQSGSGAEIVPANSASSCSSGPVVAGSPAARAGLQPGETITKVNGKAIASSDAFIQVISAYQPGDTVTLTVEKPHNGGTAQVKVTLGNRPKSAPTAG
ncbi:MAG TPA: trypsin-like peptidase domain-containing protein [Solirubrobacteraceae bacterium]|nr:trypsin-like peptidase domain-containing protein [Solirubrobacteraceae bacterium]